MALEPQSIIRPGSQGGAAFGYNAAHSNTSVPVLQAHMVEQVQAEFERNFAVNCIMKNVVQFKEVVGTNTHSNFAAGIRGDGSSVKRVTPGVVNGGNNFKFGKHKLVVDTLFEIKDYLPLLESKQVPYDAAQEIARAQGEEFGIFIDKMLFIAAIKAAQLTATPYTGLGANEGFTGGNQKVLSSAADRTNPAILLQKIMDLGTALREKNVPLKEQTLIMRPADVSTLAQAEMLVNRDWITSEGIRIEQMPHIKAYGVPVVESNNLPQEDVTGHILSNSGNGNAYDGDFTKVVALMFAARSLKAGYTVAETNTMDWDKEFLSWRVHSYGAFGAASGRPESSGLIVLP